MGYDFGVYLPGGWQTIPSDQTSGATVGYSKVDCTGYESSIWDCSMDDLGTSTIRRLGATDCDTFEDTVAVYCSRFC